jgi:hypothetical protein
MGRVFIALPINICISMLFYWNQKLLQDLPNAVKKANTPRVSEIPAITVTQDIVAPSSVVDEAKAEVDMYWILRFALRLLEKRNLQSHSM